MLNSSGLPDPDDSDTYDDNDPSNPRYYLDSWADDCDCEDDEDDCCSPEYDPQADTWE